MAQDSTENPPLVGVQPRRGGRPYGQKYGRAKVVRLPIEAEAALDQARALYGLTVSDVVRESIMLALPRVIERAVKLARNEKRSPSKRRRAIALIDQCAKAAIAMSPGGAETLAPLREYNEEQERKKLAEREAKKARREAWRAEKRRQKRVALAEAARPLAPEIDLEKFRRDMQRANQIINADRRS